VNVNTTYIPALHDLYLYESYTTPQGFVTLRPYAFNPNSLLYGYRYSLEGLMATYRTFSTTRYTYGFPTVLFDWRDFNAPTVENRAAFANSWPSAFRVLHKNVCFPCGHVIACPTLADRFPIQTMAQWAYPNLQDQCSWRWIRGNNDIIDISTSRMSKPYYFDSSWPYSTMPISVPKDLDQPIVELFDDFPGNPLRYIDALTIPVGATCWIIDGSQKIVTGKLAFSGVQRENFGNRSWPFMTGMAGLNPPPNGAISTHFACVVLDVDRQPIPIYVHDSGSSYFFEIKPPTSVAAGDGILGTLVGVLGIGDHVGANRFAFNYVSSSAQDAFDDDWQTGRIRYSGIGTSRADLTNPIITAVNDYWQHRGWEFPTYYPAYAVRPIASNSVLNSVASQVEGFLQRIS
jgi:hypothetical protein